MTEHANGRPPRRRQPNPLDPAKIRRRRIAKGLSLSAAAAAAGITKGALSLIENGHRGGTMRTVVAIASALECEITDLMPDAPRSAAR
ncbi:helix-turn-helix transcriptional regulator [Actinoplanes sp. NPDC049316]|uniref:helix-turn-helix domain-containing protein n=1 Tax=Actinoplanes sp. NPDC049316 TaxID=3154727 RepID=UPI00341E696D